jgi:hypothetical protein
MKKETIDFFQKIVIASHSLENHECHVYVHVHELYAPGLTGYDYLLILCISPYVLEKNLVWISIPAECQ